MSTNRVFTKYKDPVNSFPLGEMNIGLMKPGRYSGFDIMEEVVGLNIKINHTTRIRKASANIDDTIELTTFGALFMPNGSTIHNQNVGDANDGINLTLDTNLGNPNNRYDLIVCEHEYIQVQGGQPPVYMVIKGPMDGTIPVLPNPEKQIIVGIVELKIGGYLFNSLTYTKAPVPLIGDINPAELLAILNIQYPSASTTVIGMTQYATGAEAIARVLTDKALSPATVVQMIATETLPGMVKKASNLDAKLALAVDKFVSPDLMRKYARRRDLIVHDNNTPLTLSDDHNGRAIVLAGDGGGTPLINITVPTSLIPGFICEVLCDTQKVKFLADTGVTFLLPPNRDAETISTGTSLTIKIVSPSKHIFEGDLKVTTVPTFGYIMKNGVIDYFPENDDMDEFDATGLGIVGDLIGWAICNGNNNTRDLRGRFTVGYHIGDADYNESGKTGGAKTVTLTQAQMPVHSHSMTYGNLGAGAAQVKADDDGDTVLGNTSTGNAGGSAGVTQSHENRPPYYTAIKIQRIV